MKAILLMLGALSAAIIFVGCGTAVGRATGVDENPPVLDDKAKGSMAFSVADMQKVVDTAIVGEREKQKEEASRQEEKRRQEEERMRQAEEERREQERREEEERIAREIQAAMDDAKEREAIIERCDNQAREQFRWTKMTREETERRTQEAFQECLSDADLEGAGGERGTSQQQEVDRGMEEAAQRNVAEAMQNCMERAIGDGAPTQEALAEARAMCQTNAREAYEDVGGAPGAFERAREEGASRRAAEAMQTCLEEIIGDGAPTQEALAEARAMCQTNAREAFEQMGGAAQEQQEEEERVARQIQEAIEEAEEDENEREGIIQACRQGILPISHVRFASQEGFDAYKESQQSTFTDCLRENGIEEDIEYEESPDMERQLEQDQDVAPLAEQAEELAEEEAPVDGTAEERIAALEERVAELTELIRDLTEALQPN